MMYHKLKQAAALGTALAAGYSFLPSSAAKCRRRLSRMRGHEEHLSGAPKVIYLTFDDGPHPVFTEQLLNLLAAYQVHATFFVVGKFAEENPQLIRRMEKEGHCIGMHSYSHKSAMLQSPKQTAEDFRRCLSVMERLGIKTRLYRPPWGHVNWMLLHQLKKAGMKKLLWDVMAQDWQKEADEETIQYKLLKRTRPGDVVCLHDRQADCDEAFFSEACTGELPPARMLAALGKTIPIWQEEGYVFETIG